MRHSGHRPMPVDDRDAAEERPRQLLGRVGIGLDRWRRALEQLLQRSDSGADLVRLTNDAEARQQLMHQPDTEADSRPWLTGEPIFEQWKPVLGRLRGEPPTGRDDGDRKASLAGGTETGQGLGRLT